MLLNVRTWSQPQPYQPVWEAMRAFTQQRDAQTVDELWFMQHEPVFTQGLAGKREHILTSDHSIPVIQTDRGGQVTYHGPGQLMIYTLFDCQRLALDTRSFVCRLEAWIISALGNYGIAAHGDREAPGVYVDDKKIASIGLRVKKQGAYHGISLNVSLSLQPFQAINPCGYAGLQMTDCARESKPCSVLDLESQLLQTLDKYWPYTRWERCSEYTLQPTIG